MDSSDPLRDQMIAQVRSIIDKRLRRYAGQTSARVSFNLLDWDAMSEPDVFLDLRSVEDPSFEMEVFYYLLARSETCDREAFVDRVIHNVVDNPKCECAATIAHLDAALDVSDSTVSRYLRHGRWPGRLAEALAVEQPPPHRRRAGKWPANNFALI